MTGRASTGGRGAPAASARAFTLIELLVVIAILAILAAVLLPALHKAKNSSQSIGCCNNQKQLQLAWEMYHEEHDDRLVPNFERGTYGNVPSCYSTSNSWISGSALRDCTAAGIRQGTLWPYARNERIYRCPSDKTLWPYGVERAPRPWNVALSFYMNGRWNDDVYPIPVKASKIRWPALSFTFIDEEETLLTGGAFVLQEGQEGFWWTVPASRDRGYGASAAFADGHVEFHKWKYPHRIRKTFETPIANAPDREDLRWLLSWVQAPGSRSLEAENAFRHCGRRRARSFPACPAVTG